MARSGGGARGADGGGTGSWLGCDSRKSWHDQPWLGCDSRKSWHEQHNILRVHTLSDCHHLNPQILLPTRLSPSRSKLPNRKFEVGIQLNSKLAETFSLGFSQLDKSPKYFKLRTTTADLGICFTASEPRCYKHTYCVLWKYSVTNSIQDLKLGEHLQICISNTW